MLPADATAPIMARDALAPLTPWVPAETAQDLRLLVSELVTNAVEHAGLREGEGIDLEVSAREAQAEVRVRYPEHRWFPPTLPAEPVGEDPTLGLFLVDRVSDRWSLVEEEGTVVAWCELAVPSRHG